MDVLGCLLGCWYPPCGGVERRATCMQRFCRWLFPCCKTRKVSEVALRAIVVEDVDTEKLMGCVRDKKLQRFAQLCDELDSLYGSYQEAQEQVNGGVEVFKGERNRKNLAALYELCLARDTAKNIYQRRRLLVFRDKCHGLNGDEKSVLSHKYPLSLASEV